MPLLKRKANGEFEEYRKSSMTSSSPATATQSSSLPPAKRAKTMETHPTTRREAASPPSSSDLASNPLYPIMPQTLGRKPDHWPEPIRPTSATSSPPPPKTTSSQPVKQKQKSKEKRQARYRGSASSAIMQRLERAKYQRFFMIRRERSGDELKETFSVLGSTGNVYTVTVDHLPRCDCPDFQKGNHCKHIIFVFIKVLQVPQDSTNWYQKALLIEELEEIFTNAPTAPNSLANDRVREAHARATGKAPVPASSSQTNKRRAPGEEDDCPICYEGMHNQPDDKLVWCEACGNAIHKECFGQWQMTSRNQGKELTCVFCRADWIAPCEDVHAARGGARVGSGGYLNLSQVAGVSPQRDTSTYYAGPRRGRRYGSHLDYDDDDIY